MKLAVIGGTGLIGSQVVQILIAGGHEAVPHAPSTGLDLLSGRGLPEALRGADVVVNLTNSPTSAGHPQHRRPRGLRARRTRHDHPGRPR